MSNVSTERAVALIDVDGIIYDFVSEFRNTVMRLTGRRAETLPYPTKWNFYEDWGLTSGEFQDLFIRSVKECSLLRTGMPMPRSVKAWQRLREIPLLLHIISDAGCDGCRPEAESNRNYWLASWGFVADSVTYTADKAAVVKHYISDGWKVFGVEDNVDHFNAMSEAGAEMWLAHHLHNQHLVVPMGRRVRGFDHFALRLESTVRYR